MFQYVWHDEDLPLLKALIKGLNFQPFTSSYKCNTFKQDVIQYMYITQLVNPLIPLLKKKTWKFATCLKDEIMYPWFKFTYHLNQKTSSHLPLHPNHYHALYASLLLSLAFYRICVCWSGLPYSLKSSRLHDNRYSIYQAIEGTYIKLHLTSFSCKKWAKEFYFWKRGNRCFD